jgi:hypothetical protein
MTAQTTYTLEDVVDAIGAIPDAMNPQNDHGYTVGDTLHEISWKLERIADALEKIASK